jgi:hypothetical protein
MSNEMTFAIAVRLGEGVGGNDPGRWAGLDHIHRALLGRRRRHHAAVRLHDVERRRHAERGEPPFQRVEVARDDRHDGGVNGGGTGAEVLAELRAHLR